MITLSKRKSAEILFMGETVEVEYVVPTALDVEEHIKGSTKDSSVFEAFVTKVSSSGIDGWQNGVGAKAVLEAPGTYSLVNKVALEIVQSAFITEAEKNA